MQAITFNPPVCTTPTISNTLSPPFNFLSLCLGFPKDERSCKFRRRSSLVAEIRAVDGINGVGRSRSPWDERPYELSASGKRAYLDEQDIVTLLDPPRELIPLDPASFSPAAYMWKKIGDIPEERRYRLLSLLKPTLISRLWEIAGHRYDDTKLVNKSASNLLSPGDSLISSELWRCRTNGGPMPIAWTNSFKMAVFRGKHGEMYGRMILDGSVFARIAVSFSPLYFRVSQLKEVMPTEQPCDLAYEFGDGILDLQDYPKGFPIPAKHPQPFDDHVVVYVRHVGPGVMVAQAWQEGKVLEQVPKKFCGEILMVKDYATRSED